jgi:hypothetical protein
MKIDLKDKKHLIVSGCSFTIGHNLHDDGSWGYHLSKLLDVEFHNIARGGAGNEYICDSIIRYIINLQNNYTEDITKDCIVGVAWSELTRLLNPIPLENGGHRETDTVRPQDFLKDGKYYNYKDASEFFSDIPFCVYRTYMAIIKLTYFLQANNIPYFFIDAINTTKVEIKKETPDIFFLGGDDYSSISFSLKEHCYWFKETINRNINSKFFNKFLTTCEYPTISDYLWHDDGTHYDELTKDNDGHPGEFASKQIAESIYNQIK